MTGSDQAGNPEPGGTSEETLTFRGFHHLTAVSSQIRENKRFYTETLGLRLVKRSVNQDDTSAYHLFYADKVGTPGTDITFFDWDVPLRVGGAAGAITGTLTWVGRPGGGFPVAAGIALAAVVLGGIALVVVVRRQRRRGGDGDGERPAGPAKEAW